METSWTNMTDQTTAQMISCLARSIGGLVLTVSYWGSPIEDLLLTVSFRAACSGESPHSVCRQTACDQLWTTAFINCTNRKTFSLPETHYYVIVVLFAQKKLVFYALSPRAFDQFDLADRIVPRRNCRLLWEFELIFSGDLDDINWRTFTYFPDTNSFPQSVWHTHFIRTFAHRVYKQKLYLLFTVFEEHAQRSNTI